MRRKPLKNVFISSIHQNAGKTTVSLGLVKVLKEKKYKTTFMKPVGQQVVQVGEADIDKDSYLIGEVFRAYKSLKDMSPITIGRGYTEKYIMNPNKVELEKKILRSFKKLTKNKRAIVVEGTGHAGVGAVIDLSNADVAHLLGSKVIIISEGGIGKCIDEMMLNKALFDLKGVEVVGAIVNKVLPEKYDRIKKILEKGLKAKGIKLLGVIPTRPLLSAPTVEQVKNRLDLQFLCGAKISMQRRVKHTIVAAMEPQNMINYLQDGTLVVTSGDRIDNIMVAVSSHLVRDCEGLRISGLILTGGLTPPPKVLDLLKKSRMPVLMTENDTYTVAAQIEDLVPKILKTDKDKIREAKKLVKQYVNVEYILENI
jgi:BioD-like phosphotransacetylase family protein